MNVAEVKRQLAEQETIIYQITHYMLQQEDRAMAAAGESLLILGRNEQFTSAPLSTRRAMAIKVAMRCALRHAWPKSKTVSSVSSAAK